MTLYASQKQRIAELHVKHGRGIQELAEQFNVDQQVIVRIIRSHPLMRSGARERLIAESLCWQAEHGRAV
jgi:hypothetical protein